METELSQIGVGDQLRPAILRMIDRLDKQPAEVWDENVLKLGLTPEQLSALKALLANNDLWQRSEELQALFMQLEGAGRARLCGLRP